MMKFVLVAGKRDTHRDEQKRRLHTDMNNSGGDVCMLCWEFMTVAIKVIDTALRGECLFNSQI